MTNRSRSPEELRTMFGANLRLLAQNYPSVSELCRQLGINRTQFNRYLSGESFPRPDVLDRICGFFNVDARILLKPLGEFETQPRHPSIDFLDQFLTAHRQPDLPVGFFHSAETDPDDTDHVQNRLFYVRKTGQTTLLRGYEPRALMPEKPPAAREVRGIVCRSGSRVFVLMSRRGGRDHRVMSVSESPSDGAPIWTGHITYLAGASGKQPVTRATALVHLGDSLPVALNLGRAAPEAPSRTDLTTALS